MERKLKMWLLACLFSASALLPTLSAKEVRDYAIELSALVQKEPAQIELKWRPVNDGVGFSVARKLKDSSQWTTLAAALPPTATAYLDRNVVPGTGYEYRVLKNPAPAYGGSGFIYAGIDLPLVENRGTVVLVVDATHSTALSAELTRLQQDLVGDGWTVSRRDVSRSATPRQVKDVIRAVYQADPTNVKAVFLFGHVPVPYSGNIVPDGHHEHQGAWPADGYYADMDGSWTDSSVNSGGADRPQNRNVPGDGKFDQSTLPGDVELMVGRVDLANLPGFAPKTELDLLRQYLNKDHAFRHGRMQVERRALVNDNFGEMYGEAFGSSGYRNFATFFGHENTDSIIGWLYFPTLKDKGYLVSYACGGGSYNYCNYVGGTGDFGVHDPKTVFTFMLGSYFGDWDADNNFLRAPLGSPTYGLTAAWAGRPHWFVHHMALGETIGYGAKMTMNSTPYHPQQYARSIHIGLMGDPTLRLHPVLPAGNLTARKSANGVQLAWTSSADPEIQGYHVYKAATEAGPYTRITEAPIGTHSLTDSSAPGTVYMVRAVKREMSASGTYLNASQGIFAKVTDSGTGSIPLAIEVTSDSVRIRFPSELGEVYTIELSTTLGEWSAVGTVTAAGPSTTSAQPKAAGNRFYRVRRLS